MAPTTLLRLRARTTESIQMRAKPQRSGRRHAEPAQEAELERTSEVAALFASIAEESPPSSDDSDSDSSSSDSKSDLLPDDVSIRRLRDSARRAPGTTVSAVPHTGVDISKPDYAITPTSTCSRTSPSTTTGTSTTTQTSTSTIGSQRSLLLASTSAPCQRYWPPTNAPCQRLLHLLRLPHQQLDPESSVLMIGWPQRRS